MVDRSLAPAPGQDEALPLLPDNVPVLMPNLPPRLVISTEQQFKAISDMARSRILGVIQYQPLTAKQIAQRLQATPGAIGHHLRVLEEAGLIKIVARRLTRGIVASYYTRAARMFDYNLPPEVRGVLPINFDIFSRVQAELMDSMVSYEEKDLERSDAFPHVRLSSEKAMEYQQRFIALIDELVDEKPDPNGEIYGVFFSIFKSPPYMQVDVTSDEFLAEDV